MAHILGIGSQIQAGQNTYRVSKILKAHIELTDIQSSRTITLTHREAEKVVRKSR